MKCNKCGNQVDNGLATCPNCGQPVVTTGNGQENSNIMIGKIVLYLIMGIIMLFIELIASSEGLIAVLASAGIGLIAGVIVSRFFNKGLRVLTGIVIGIVVWFLYGFVTEPILISDSMPLLIIFLFVPTVILNTAIIVLAAAIFKSEVKK